uniref:IKAROS family zinc finger 4 n=1 Tax=Seriola lalandi dorsalis TaxID=1841481 RepID=A0A3B4YWQ8_SERLL
MDVDDCNGRSYISASGDSSMEREFSGALGGPTVSTPNSKETSPTRSLSANSIKVELYSDEDPGRSTEDERGERVEEGGPEQGSEAVGGFRELTNPETMPTGATRLPNGKLKCDVCGMICIGPNVLMVHKRSHTGERPFQCNQCGASFTQKGNLLRHIKLHSGEKPFKCPFCSYACRRRDALTGHLRTHAGKPYKCSYCGRSYKQQSTLEEHRERCHSYLQSLESQHLSLSIVGQKHIRLNLGDAPYEFSAGLDRDGEMHAGDLEAPHFTGLGGEYTGIAGNGAGVSDTLRPLHLPTTHPSCLSELRPIHSSSHTPIALGPRLDWGREAAEGHEDLPVGRSHVPSPSNGCQDSTDTESILHSNNGHSAPPPPALAPTPSSPTAPSSTSREAFRVVDGEGRAVRSFRCEHCRVLFLDHVMFTIHMGCHGFRQPFECNICGHRSQDRYEFSSHIVRGEHILD